jgi:hypothetical protein
MIQNILLNNIQTRVTHSFQMEQIQIANRRSILFLIIPIVLFFISLATGQYSIQFGFPVGISAVKFRMIPVAHPDVWHIEIFKIIFQLVIFRLLVGTTPASAGAVCKAGHNNRVDPHDMLRSSNRDGLERQLKQ